MKKYLIATHGKLSYGFKDTLELIIGIRPNVEYVSAYADGYNDSINENIMNIMSNLDDKDELIVCTDILGGSVTNQFLKYLNKANIHLITGINLPLLIEMILSTEQDTNELIKNSINKAKEGIIYVNDLLKEQHI